MQCECDKQCGYACNANVKCATNVTRNANVSCNADVTCNTNFICNAYAQHPRRIDIGGLHDNVRYNMNLTCNTQTSRRRRAGADAGEPQTWYDNIARERGTVISGPSKYGQRFLNSVIIGFGSTALCMVLGTMAAYAFSRFKVPLKDDLLFFILSTRMMPPIAVAIPIFLMFRQLGLNDTHLGMILLYTAVNLSLSVWLLKGFIDEIPVEYEEAALIDGYTRFQAFYKVVLPQAATGIASTAIFCLIFAWNEYAFAVLLTSGNAQTAPPFIPNIIGTSGKDWPAVAAGATIFLVPVMIFTILLRKHLLRGITFGAVRK